MRDHFAREGLAPVVEEDSDETNWIVFEPNELTIYVSFADGIVTFATVNIGLSDDLSVYSIVERILISLGFSADEDADFA
jgi:hypothetical protein